MPAKTKPNSDTDSLYGKCGRQRGKERVSTRGGLADAEKMRSNNEPQEVSRGHSAGEKPERAEQS